MPPVNTFNINKKYNFQTGSAFGGQVKKRPVVWLTEDQIPLLLSTDDDEFKKFLQLLLYTGMRRNEALELTWSDIDDNINIRPEISKNGIGRQIVLNSNLKTILSQGSQISQERLFPNYTPNQISMKFMRWVREIGLPAGTKLHSIRATFACQLLVKGVDIFTISKLLGHSSIKITEKYYLALDQSKARNAVEKLCFDI